MKTLKKIPLPNKRISVPSRNIHSGSFSSGNIYSIPSYNSTLPKVDIENQLKTMNFNQENMNRKLIRMETRLGGIEKRLGDIETNSRTQTTILRSMETLMKEICQQLNNLNIHVSENGSEKSNISQSSSGTAIYKRRNMKP